MFCLSISGEIAAVTTNPGKTPSKPVEIDGIGIASGQDPKWRPSGNLNDVICYFAGMMKYRIRNQIVNGSLEEEKRVLSRRRMVMPIGNTGMPGMYEGNHTPPDHNLDNITSRLFNLMRIRYFSMKIFIVSFLLAVVALQPSHAAEIDSVTPRSIHLENSRQIINEIFNKRLLEGIEKANGRQGDIEKIDADDFCDEEILYTELRKAIFQSFTASWGLKGYGLDTQLRELLFDKSYSLSLNDSIYRDINYIEGMSLNIKELSDVVTINGQLVGLDKIGHFFAEGWHYFEMVQEEGASVERALEWGRERETGRFGYVTTGIFSFADLVANFNGFRFWNRILLKDNDPLLGFFKSLFDSPYVTCDIQLVESIKHFKVVKAWSRNRRFDVSLYVDGVWDEGNNCNSYADPYIEEKVSSRIEEVKADFRCPDESEQCFEAQEKYGVYAKHILHPYCMAAGKK